MAETRNFTIWDFEKKEAIELPFKRAGEHRWKALCCFHQERHESLYYYDLTESYYCFGGSCGRHGISYEKYLKYVEHLKSYNLVEQLGDPVASYPYRDEGSNLLYQKFRFEKRNEGGKIEKTFRLWRPDEKGRVIRNIQGVRRVLYNLDKINNSGDKVINLMEGEKDCDNVMTRFEGILATTADIGAGKGDKKWRPEYYDHFQDRIVNIYPDNDEGSRVFYQEIGNNLVGIAKSIKWIILPGLKEHGDMTDWLMQGGTLEDLFELIKNAPEFPLPVPIEKKEYVSLLEVKKANLIETEMIIDGGLIPKIEGFGMIGGETKEGKTIFALEMSLSLISGNYFLEDFLIKKKCVVAYIYHENTLKGMDKITDIQIAGFAEKGNSIKNEDIDNFYLINGKKMLFGLSLEDSELGNLIEDLKEIKPDVIFLDPLMQFVGFSLNDAKNIKSFDDLMQQIYPCFWMLIHHYVKPHSLQKGESNIPPIYKMLGSSYLANACETFIGMEREGEDYVEEYKMIYFTVRHERTPYPMHLYRNPDTLRYEVLDSTSIKKGKMSIQDIAKVLEKSFGKTGASHKDLTNLCGKEYGIKPANFDRLLRDAKDAGIIFKAEGRKGRWYNKNLTL